MTEKLAHIYEVHQFCDAQHCPICMGGLAVCTVCGQAEAELEESCPGAPPKQQDHGSQA